MKKLLIILCSMVILQSCTEEDLKSVLNNGTGLSNEEIIEGLKSALNVGTDTSVTILNKVNGYFLDETVKILLPPEAQAIYTNIGKVPGGSLLLDETIRSMNRAAEDAAVEAKPIFVDAITGITIEDGLGILNGNEDAATQYLKGKTFNSLTAAFSPKINTSLSKELIPGLSANSAYTNLVSAYNTASLDGLLFPKITNTNLADHVTKKALDGLFLKVALEEKDIRNDPLARVNDILKKVFGK
ncbi:MAG: DUF4197 domain-containing protein [Bacteroidota bacterium]